MAYTDIYYNNNNNNHDFILTPAYYPSILTHQTEPQPEQYGQQEDILYEKKDALLYASNEFIHQYDSLLTDDNFSIATVNEYLQPSNQLTPLLTPSPELSIYQPTIVNSNESLFAPIQKKETKSRKSSTTTTSLEKKHICPTCDHRSKRKHNLIEHMLTHNPHRPKTFLCSFCSRAFARKYDMKRHEKIHTR